MNDWIDNKKRKPRKTDEYQVVWNLEDNHYPVTTCMEWQSINKVWVDIINGRTIQNSDKILYWKRLDKPPKGISKAIYNPHNY